MFPDTPKTLFARMQQGSLARVWEASWDEFFDLYHEAVRWCVLGGFRRHGWRSVDEHAQQDVVMSVFTSIVRGHAHYDPAKGRFRQWLSGVCAHRVADFIRQHARTHTLGTCESEARAEDAAALQKLREQEDGAFRTALLGTLLVALRAEVPPRIHLIFELVKLTGKTPAEVAQQLDIKRSVVDNSVYKAMEKLREIAARSEITDEFNL